MTQLSERMISDNRQPAAVDPRPEPRLDRALGQDLGQDLDQACAQKLDQGQGVPPGPTDASGDSDRPEEPEKKKIDMVEMAVTFVSPALFGKLLILYFGSNYSSKPGQGYGIGLVITIIFTVVMLARFIWRYKDYAEEE